MRYLLLLAVFLAGCTGSAPKRILLDQRFAPLVSVEEAPYLPGLKPTMVATIGTTAYTLDLAALVAAYPVGSVDWDALFLHEAVHSRNQAMDPLFFYYYATQPTGFRWGEERRGWSVELHYLKDHGRHVDPDRCARTLSGNYDGMVSFEDARAWVVQEVGE